MSRQVERNAREARHREARSERLGLRQHRQRPVVVFDVDAPRNRRERRLAAKEKRRAGDAR